MKNEISKLSILFILATLVPGSVLTYFSIQNISGMKDLTVQRMEEDQERRAVEFSRRFDDRLLQDTERFFSIYDSLSAHPLEAILVLDSLDFVEQPFLLNRNGRFLWPNVIGIPSVPEERVFSEAFSRRFEEAERAEFADRDPGAASGLYRRAMNDAASDIERAAALNGLARVLVKRGSVTQAFQGYRRLVHRFGSVVDVTGSPFAHYALHQSIRHSASRAMGDVVEEMQDVLTRMLRGAVPLTMQTETILQEVEAWWNGWGAYGPDQRRDILKKVERIRSNLVFVEQVGEELGRRAVGNQAPSTRLDRFHTFPLIREDRLSLFVLNPDEERSRVAGFRFELAQLGESVVREFQPELESLDMHVEIMTGNREDVTDAAPMALVRDLSRFLPGWRLRIQHRNPSEVLRYIMRRRLIYTLTVALLLAGMFLGVFLVLRDVSREQKLARLRSDFVSNVTHELKTPLTSIRMFAETLRMGRVRKKEDREEYLSIIVSESERLTRLINTVLDFSKIERREKQYHMAPVDLSRVVEDATAALDHRLKKLGFALKTDIEPGLVMIADGDAVEQAVLNLVSNAMKYSGDGKEIAVRLQRKGEELHLRVRDEGMGIPESKLPFIFDKYYRAHGGHAKDQGGSGLGLTVVKHVADAHHGRIEVESEVNEGSTFTVVLPMRGSETEETVHA